MQRSDPSVRSSIREQLLDACENHVNNNLPTHLIRIADMKLVTRNDFWDTNRLDVAAKVDSITKEHLCIPKSHLNAWCQVQF